MSAKRALIVDDSRSARVILSRMLEQYGLQVDTAESGEQALEYLRSARPDVVFMDHLMPGMDGFDALRAIKANQQTAAIPVMMYTSQEGDNYMQQARKVGAVGVLSKTLKPTDVSRTLYELNLLPDRREFRSTLAAQSANAEKIAMDKSSAPQEVSPPTERRVDVRNVSLEQKDLRATVAALVNEQQAELHAILQANLDSMTDKVGAEVRLAIQQAAQHAMQSGSIAASPASSDDSNGTRSWFAVALLLIALIPTGVIATLYWRTLNEHREQLALSASRLAMVVTEQQTQIEQLRAELRKRQEAAGELATALPNTEAIAVPYGEVALSGPRIARLNAMLDRLKGEQFHGKLRVSTFTGDFCLSGNAINGFKLAHDDLPARRCDLIGNPFEDALPAAQRESPELTAILTAQASGKLPVEVQAEGRKPLINYPPQSDKLTAGEWNRIAARNHRVEFVAVPAE